MNIIATVRTLNAERFIDEFCQSYTWADELIIADGGSEDNTLSLASKYSNVYIIEFNERVYKDGVWRNPHGKHINLLIDTAEQRGADWIIFDDADCIPNYEIKNEYIDIFADAEADGCEFILANRVYIYGRDQYFEKLTCPDNLSEVEYDSEFIPSLWAWKAGLGFRASEDDPFRHEFNKRPTDYPRKELYPPYGLLHYFYPTDDYMQNKLEFYRKIYHKDVLDPIDYGGRLLPLEEWMRK